jgi:DNA helicase IV
MRQTWGSTPLGQGITSSQPWSLSMDGDQFSLIIAGVTHSGAVIDLENLTLKPGFFWCRVTLPQDIGPTLHLDGIPNAAAREMHEAVKMAAAAVRRREHITRLLGDLPNEVERIKDWVSQTRRAFSQEIRRRGWLSHEFTARVADSRPTALAALLAEPEIESHLAHQDAATQEAIAAWRRPIAEVAAGIHQWHLERELNVSRHFFDNVEKSPLTPEQIRAVVCFDNRVLLVAAAGSGKTSTMVAKVGYALKQGYFAPERILLLAFNNDAAAELRERLRARLLPLGLPSEQVTARTFHAFGLEVIGAATGKKPSLAAWIEAGRDQEVLTEMVDELRSSEPSFQIAWDLFRWVFDQDLPDFDHEEDHPEAADPATGHKGFRTLKGDVVKSRGEVILADWLFYNGVDYRYEEPYRIDTADAQHRQYKPDFYLPGADVYLELWGLNAKSEPPKDFVGYREAMAWKRSVHVANGTTLLETTSAEVRSGQAFVYLEAALRQHGLELTPNPDRETPGRKPMDTARLLRTLRSFLTHAKSNRLSPEDLRQRLKEGHVDGFRYRHELFLRIFERVQERWEQRLRVEGCIDFDDMLNQAADCIEQGLWKSPYELVMVDEFQDASQARARLVAALVDKPGRHLFAVGDDWQSINRFAGADLGVMTNFEARFGPSVVLRLETTFRCPQKLCDISSRFVQKNPLQIPKNLRSAKNDVAAPVRIMRVKSEHRTRSAIAARLAEIAQEHSSGERPITVYVLGRYRRDVENMPPIQNNKPLRVEFVTVHSSKGLEADHIIVPGLISDRLGFPSQLADDPVLKLAMPGGEDFEFAEERRLFYVALTRARQTVTLVTVARKESAFITELARDFNLPIVNADGATGTNEVCPQCSRGFLVLRDGPYSRFFGCSRYPICEHTSQDNSVRDEEPRNRSRRS